MPVDIFGCHTGRRRSSWHVVGGDQRCWSTPHSTRDASPQCHRAPNAILVEVAKPCFSTGDSSAICLSVYLSMVVIHSPGANFPSRGHLATSGDSLEALQLSSLTNWRFIGVGGQGWLSKPSHAQGSPPPPSKELSRPKCELC